MSGRPFESRIQDLVYNVDVGFGLIVIKGLLYLLFVVVLAAVYTASEFRGGLKDDEAMEFAQLGHSLATQGQLATRCIRPASLWYLINHRADQNPQLDHHPDILHPPVYPALLAVVFTLFQPGFTVEGSPGAFIFPADRWVIGVCHLCTALTGLMIYLLGRRLFEQRVAALAATVFFLSDAVWRHSVSANTIPLTTLLVTTALTFGVAAVQSREQESPLWRGILLLGGCAVFSALAVLTRYATVVLLPGLALLAGWLMPGRRWIWAGGYLAVALLCVAPWLVRNLQVSGGLLGLAPYAALNETGMYEERTFENQFNFQLDGRAALRSIQAKCLNNLSRFYDGQLRTAGNGVLACLFLATFFFKFARRDVNSFRWCAALSLALLSIVASYFGGPTLALAHVFLPVFILYGLSFFFLLLDRLQLPLRVLNISVVSALVLWCCLSLIITLLPPRAGPPYPPYFPPFISHVSQMLGEEELLCTDMPWATAWYGQRKSLLLPMTLDEFYEINDYHKRISGLYFTTITRDKPYIRTLATGPYRTWFPILEGRIPSDFPLTQGFPLNNLDQIFLTDRVRWSR